MCKGEHPLIDHVPEPSLGCIRCANLGIPLNKQCQCYEEDKNYRKKSNLKDLPKPKFSEGAEVYQFVK